MKQILTNVLPLLPGIAVAGLIVWAIVSWSKRSRNG
jgi:hypothetical protein